jgi:hypothetical protein
VFDCCLYMKHAWTILVEILAEVFCNLTLIYNLFILNFLISMLNLIIIIYNCQAGGETGNKY